MAVGRGVEMSCGGSGGSVGIMEGIGDKKGTSVGE